MISECVVEECVNHSEFSHFHGGNNDDLMMTNGGTFDDDDYAPQNICGGGK